MLQNAFDIPLETPIFRIFQFKYFIEDVKNEQLTLVKPAPETWGDPLENPLLNHEFPYENGKVVTFKEIMNKYWGLSWTIDDVESYANWLNFSHNNLAVRVKTTVHKLLDRIMNLQNIYFMIDYHIGKVEYCNEKEILDWISNSSYLDFIDSLGQSTAISLMTLCDDLTDEKEIRLVYSYGPQEDNKWVKENVIIADGLCRHPFSWENVVDEIIFGPSTTQKEYIDSNDILNTLNIRCPINKSSL